MSKSSEKPPQKLQKAKVSTMKFGEHLIFDAYNCKYEKLNNMELCFELLNKLTTMAKMRKISEPYVIKADGNETLGGKDPGGFSGFVMIQESHISIHTFARRGFVTIDLYSCKPFNTEGIVEFLKDTFETDDVTCVKMDRGLKYPANNIY